MRTGILALLASAPLVAAAAPTGHIDAGGTTRIELVPDYDGDARLRVAHSLRLDLDIGSRWRVDAHAAARFGGSWRPSGVVDLYRAAVHYEAPTFGLAAGRLFEPGTTGRLLLDGIALRFGGRDTVLGGRAWLGHTWQPEVAWEDSKELAGGAELELRPISPAGLSTGVSAAIGGSLRGNGGLPQARAWLHGEGRNVRGGNWRAGIEASVGEGVEPGSVPLHAWAAAATPLGAAVDLGFEARWHALPPLGVPLGLPGPLEILAPDGYGVARGRLGVRAGPMEVSLEGGPTLRPRPGHSPAVGGIGRLTASASIGSHLHLGGTALGAGVAPSWLGGGGVFGALTLPALHAEAAATVLRAVGLNRDAQWLGEGRARASVRVPLPAGRLRPELRFFGEVAGGADRLLASWIRGGLGVEAGASARLGRSTP